MEHGLAYVLSTFVANMRPIWSYCAARLNVSCACLVGGELACFDLGAILNVAWHLHMQKRMPIGKFKLSDPQVPGTIPTDANLQRKSCRTRIQATRLEDSDKIGRSARRWRGDITKMGLLTAFT